MIALILLLAPGAVVLAFVLRHRHLDSGAVGILATACLGLPALWLAWVGYRVASRPSLADRSAGPGIITAGPGSVIAERGGTAIGQVVYQQRRGITGKPVRLADPPPLLAGREDLLAVLDTRLTSEGNFRPRTVVLCGLGGAGKTSVALAYAHRHLGQVGVAWRFAAEDATLLAAGFAELAAQLGARDDVDPRDPVASVHGMLAAFPGEWLLIFDDAPDRATVEAFLPPAGQGRVLITSRNPNWPPGQVLEVPVLETEAAAGFLVSRTGDPDEQAATELATELGGLALALEQAGAYVQASNGSLVGYLALFRARRPEMLARGEPTGYSKTVATTWSLAFTQLEQSAPDAAGLLRLLAFCAPEAIPVTLLLRPWPEVGGQLGSEVATLLVPLLEDELAVQDAIVALRRYSLVTLAAEGWVSVHRLVQAVTMDQMPAKLAADWQRATTAVIEAALPADPQSPETWGTFASLLPHALAVPSLTRGYMSRIALYLGASGSYPAARDLFQLLADAYRQDDAYGSEDRDTLSARGNLASFTGEAGDAAGARDQYRELLPILERVLGPEHPQTLIARAQLARWTGTAGDAVGARDQFAALLPIRERVLGPEDPQTLTTRASLARWTGEAGDAAEARDRYAELLPVADRVLGPEHPEVMHERNNFAYLTGLAGDAVGARDQFAALLPIRERVLGPEHPDTLITRGNLARWTGTAGDAVGARDQFAALLPIRERVLGPEDRQTLTTRASLASWTGEAGDAVGARDQYAELLPIFARRFGGRHPQTLAVRSDIAYWTGEAGDAAGARNQYAELLPIYERVRGPKHPDTLAARSNLAYWTAATGHGSR
jgi:hypothetical protein